MNVRDTKELTLDLWKEYLNYDNLVFKWQYTNALINESMRLDASTKLTLTYQFTEKVKVLDYWFDKN